MNVLALAIVLVALLAVSWFAIAVSARKHSSLVDRISAYTNDNGPVALPAQVSDQAVNQQEG